MIRPLIMLAMIAALGCVPVPPQKVDKPDIDALVKSALGSNPHADKDYGDSGDGEGYGYESPLTPYTDKAPLLERAGGDWSTEEVTVPQEPGMKPYLCFRVKGKRLYQCMYRDQEGDVTMKWVVPQKEVM